LAVNIPKDFERQHVRAFEAEANLRLVK